jgi:hypothetical protein
MRHLLPMYEFDSAILNRLSSSAATAGTESALASQRL